MVCPPKYSPPTGVYSFRQPFHLLKHSHTHLDTGNLNSISDGVSGMISLSKYEIENKHEGQDLASVGGGVCKSLFGI